MTAVGPAILAIFVLTRPKSRSESDQCWVLHVVEDHETTSFAILLAHDISSIQEQLEEKSVAALVLQEGAEVEQEERPATVGTTSCGRDPPATGPGAHCTSHLALEFPPHGAVNEGEGTRLRCSESDLAR